MKGLSTWVLALCLTIVAACVPQKREAPPPDVLDEDQFARIMVDVQLIEAMRVHKLGPRRETSIDMAELYDEIFRKHGVTRSTFEKTFGYYTEHPDLMKDIYEQVIDSLVTLEVVVKREYQEEEMTKRDSTNKALEAHRDSVYRSLIRKK